jgi:hypothetical protein
MRQDLRLTVERPSIRTTTNTTTTRDLLSGVARPRLPKETYHEATETKESHVHGDEPTHFFFRQLWGILLIDMHVRKVMRNLDTGRDPGRHVITSFLLNSLVSLSLSISSLGCRNPCSLHSSSSPLLRLEHVARWMLREPCSNRAENDKWQILSLLYE